MTYVYRAVNKIEGNLIFLKRRHDVMFGEIVNITMPNGEIKKGKVVKIDGEITCIQVFGNMLGVSKENTTVEFTNDMYRINISSDMFGRMYDGKGKEIDTENTRVKILPEAILPIAGLPINPYSREYPKDVIQTGISSFDVLTTLVRGQKLPVFSGQGLPHNLLIAQIIKQAKVVSNEPFLIVFCGIGILNDEAIFFKKKFEESGNVQNLISIINLASDPTMERLLAPRVALTIAEYFAFEKEMHVLVILHDITNYAEALREISNALEEIPGRKGYPGYMYSDFASLFERAGRIKNRKGSITQIPVISMPNDDITHPIPDLTGYITEGQIVLSREYFQKGLYPPIWCLSSLSRLMKEVVGKDTTREDHNDVAAQLYAYYSQSLHVRELMAIIGEDGLNPLDRKYLEFADRFENEFINQSYEEERTFIQSLDLAWKLISLLPKEEITRIPPQVVEKFYSKSKPKQESD